MNLFAISGLTITITCMGLFCIVLFLGRTTLHRIWAIFNLVVAVWGTGTFLVGIAASPEEALYGWRIAFGGAIFIAVFFYHTVCIFDNRKRRKTLWYVYLQAIFFNVLNLTTEKIFNNWHTVFDTLYYNKAGLFYYLTVINWSIVVVLGHYELYSIYRNSSGFKRVQSLYLFIGFLIGFMGGAFTLLPAFGINIYPVSNFAIPIYTFIVTYAILRYRLMDINLVFKKSMVYSLSAGILTSIFVVIVIAMTKFLSDIAGVTSFAITVIAALLIAVLFNPLRIRIQVLIDRIFYKKSYDYYSTVRQVSSTLASIFDSGNIYKFIGNIIYETLGLNSICLLSQTSYGSFEAVYQVSRKQNMADHEGGVFGLDNDSEIIKRCRETKDIIIRDELSAGRVSIKHETLEKIEDEFRVFNSEAVVPVFVDGQLLLLIIMGEKMSGDMFSNEDINLLSTISDQAAVAVKNARLYSDKIHTERLASIGMMSATFAHEVRNPLTSLKTFAQLMPEKYNDTEFRDTFSKIVVGEIEKIDGLIRDLLDFSTNKHTSRINNFNMVEVVDETVEYVKGKFALAKKDIRIEKNYAENVINMSGDVTKLKQTFVNIMTNGCQAMNGNGILKVGVKRNGENVEIAVTDNGEGISRDNISRIFDPFVTSKEMGVGLGLAISKRIVEEHGGRIKVTSVLSEGATFTIILPVKI